MMAAKAVKSSLAAAGSMLSPAKIRGHGAKVILVLAVPKIAWDVLVWREINKSKEDQVKGGNPDQEEEPDEDGDEDEQDTGVACEKACRGALKCIAHALESIGKHCDLEELKVVFETVEVSFVCDCC